MPRFSGDFKIVYVKKQSMRKTIYGALKVKWGDSKNKQIQRKTRESDVKQINHRRGLIDHKLNTGAVMSFQTMFFWDLMRQSEAKQEKK